MNKLLLGQTKVFLSSPLGTILDFGWFDSLLFPVSIQGVTLLFLGYLGISDSDVFVCLSVQGLG